MPLDGATASALLAVTTAGGIIAIVVSVAVRRPATSRAWILLAAGQGFSFAAIALWTQTTASATSTATASALGLLAYGASAAGLLSLAHHLTRVWDRTRWMDSVILSVATAGTATIVLLDSAQGRPFTERWIAPAFPGLDLLLVLLATRSLLAVRERSTSLRLLTAAFVVHLVGDVAIRWFDRSSIAVSTTALLWTTAAAAVLMGAAALHPSMAHTPRRVLPWRRLGTVRFTVLMASLGVPLAALAASALAGRAPATAVAYGAAVVLTIGVLAILRVSGMVTYADIIADDRHRSRFEALALHSNDAVVILASNATITWASPAVRPVLGVEADALVGQPLGAAFGERPARDLQSPLALLTRSPAGATMAIHTTLDDDHPVVGAVVLEGVATNLLEEPAVEGIVVVVRDVTDRSLMQQQLVEQAFVDPLTGLANRALFQDRVDHALARGPKGAAGLAVLFIDLDDFKGVNDSFGHGRGDELLVEVGRRVTGALRPSDTAARLGGDEFGVLLEDVDRAHALDIATSVLDSLRQPLALDHLRLSTRASIGVAFADDPEQGSAILLRNADLAMYEAKRGGKGQVHVFRSELHEREFRGFRLRADLDRALDHGEFEVVYQPIVDLTNGRIRGAEALLRWNHPEHGPISPMEFVPLAEATRTIIPIGDWVLQTACRQLAEWNRSGATMTMDVNVSTVQLMHPGFDRRVAAIVSEANIDLGRLVLELTESVLVGDPQRAKVVLDDLHALGARLAIDDFGTGYSSLAYLQDLPIDIVKIDRAFVSRITEVDEHNSLATSIIAIAASLGMDTIAEGIEVPEQAAELVRLSCRRGQGYLYSRPVDAGAFGALLREERRSLDQAKSARSDGRLRVGEVDDELRAVGGEHVLADQDGLAPSIGRDPFAHQQR